MWSPHDSRASWWPEYGPLQDSWYMANASIKAAFRTPLNLYFCPCHCWTHCWENSVKRVTVSMQNRVCFHRICLEYISGSHHCFHFSSALFSTRTLLIVSLEPARTLVCIVSLGTLLAKCLALTDALCGTDASCVLLKPHETKMGPSVHSFLTLKCVNSHLTRRPTRGSMGFLRVRDLRWAMECQQSQVEMAGLATGREEGKESISGALWSFLILPSLRAPWKGLLAQLAIKSPFSAGPWQWQLGRPTQ